jgi:hypothetical protein
MLFILIGSNIVSLGRNKIGDAEVLTCKCEYPRAPCSIKGLSIKHAAIYKNCLFSTQLIQRSLKLATHTQQSGAGVESERASNAISITFHNFNPVNTHTRARATSTKAVEERRLYFILAKLCYQYSDKLFALFCRSAL